MVEKMTVKNRAAKMYKNSPHIEHDEKLGKKVIRKPVDDGTEGLAQKDVKAEVKTALKESMHDRHIKELEDMLKKHKKELADHGENAEDGEEEINNIENQGE